MIIQARVLLKKLKKAQRTADSQIYIDYEKLTAIQGYKEDPAQKAVDLSRFRGAIHSYLRYLEDLGYVKVWPHGIVQVQTSGWQLGQVEREEFMRFLFQSVAVPIGVSIATTLLTMWVSNLFK